MRWRRYHCPDLSIIFRLHFPAFEANKPNCTGSWRQVGWWCVKCQEGVVWKSISVVWKYIFVLENTPLRSGFARKPHFPIFLFAAREKVNTLEHRGRLWPTKVLQSHFSFSLLNSMNMTNKNQRRPKKTTWWVTSSSRKQWNNLKRNFIFFLLKHFRDTLTCQKH